MYAHDMYCKSFIILSLCMFMGALSPGAPMLTTLLNELTLYNVDVHFHAGLNRRS